MPVLEDPRHERVLHNLIKGMDHGPAWTAAGYRATGNSAQVACARFLRRPHVKVRYAELIEKAAKAMELSVERVLKEMTRLAFYDMTAVLDVKDGKITLRDPTLLPEDLRRAIVGIKPVQVGEELQYEYKFADKQRALESLARHLQMFKDTVIVENVFRIVSEMEDDELDRRLAELERAFGEATTLDPPAGEGPARIH